MKLKIRALCSGLLLCVVLAATSSVLAALIPVTASAQTVTYTAEWIDRSNIKVTGSDGATTVVTDDNWDDNWNYRGVFDGNCPVTINGFDGDTIVGFRGKNKRPWSASDSVVDIEVQRAGGQLGTSCLTTFERENFQINSYTNASIALEWIDKGTIGVIEGETINGSHWTFINPVKQPNGTTRFIRQSEINASQCQDILVVAADNQSYILYEQNTGTDGTNERSPIDGNCYLQNTIGDMAGITVSVQHEVLPSNVSLPMGSPENIELAAGSGGEAVEAEDTCETRSGVVGWLTCGLLYILDGAISFLDEKIQVLLIVPTDAYNNEGLRTTWERIRNIALLLLVPITLVMVLSTALGFTFIEAYTVKKTLPRLGAAILFIILSWTICQFLIRLTNDVGQGVLGLMTYAFGGPQGITLASLFDSNGFDGGGLFGGLLLGAGLAAGQVTGVIGIGILLSYAFIAFIALLTGFVLLTVRQVIIVALVLFAPLAILSWIFPQNNKLWKLWWETFSKLLMLFPILMVFIACGKIFASVIADSFDGTIAVFLKIVAYTAPYFFIPAAFKLAGSAFANIAGVVNNRQRGLFDGQRKKRQEGRARGYQGFKTGSGTGFLQKNALSRRIGTGVGVGYKGRFGYGERGMAATDTMLGSAVTDVMKSPAFQSNANNDPLLQAVAVGRTYGESVQNLQKVFGYDQNTAKTLAKQAGSTIGFGAAQQLAAAQQLVTTATGYKNMDQMVSTLAIASNGSASTASRLAGFANYETKKAGRADLAPSFGTLDTLVKQEAGISTGKAAPTRSEIMDNAWNSVSLYQHANGKDSALKNFVSYYEQELQSGDASREAQALTFFKEIEEMQPNASGSVRDVSDSAITRNKHVIDQVRAKSTAGTNIVEVHREGLDTIDPSTGAKVDTPIHIVNPEQRVATPRIDPGTGKQAKDPVTGAPLYDSAQRDATLGEYSDRRARTYRRMPDELRQ